MSDRLVAEHNVTPLPLLLVDSLAFWLRNQAVFWLAALPIAGLSAAITYLLDAKQQFVDLRNHWGWDFLFALIYAMFLDRWIKETLVDDASPCDEVDNLRRSTIAVRFLGFVTTMFLAAMMLSWVQLLGIADTLTDWGAPTGVTVVASTVLNWLPHLLLWATLFAGFALVLPALSAAEPATLGKAWRLGRPVHGTLFALVFGAAFLSLLALGLSVWGIQLLPKKPWAAAAMAGAWRLVDCLLLTMVGHVLATLWRQLTDWQPPEPEDHPYRGMARSRARKA